MKVKEKKLYYFDKSNHQIIVPSNNRITKSSNHQNIESSNHRITESSN